MPNLDASDPTDQPLIELAEALKHASSGRGTEGAEGAEAGKAAGMQAPPPVARSLFHQMGRNVARNPSTCPAQTVCRLGMHELRLAPTCQCVLAVGAAVNAAVCDVLGGHISDQLH